jgi:hypothetical protein
MEFADYTAFFLSYQDPAGPAFDKRRVRDRFQSILFAQIIKQKIEERMEF